MVDGDQKWWSSALTWKTRKRKTKKNKVDQGKGIKYDFILALKTP
jgi:hypothetical protein